MRADAATETAVKAVMDRLAEGYTKRDINLVLEVFAPDPDVLMYGTGADEKRIGLDQIRFQAERDWAQSEAASLVYQRIAVSAAGSIAWAAADADFNFKIGGQEGSLPARVTLVLEKRGDCRLVVQAHFSSPLAEQAEAESFPT